MDRKQEVVLQKGSWTRGIFPRCNKQIVTKYFKVPSSGSCEYFNENAGLLKRKIYWIDKRLLALQEEINSLLILSAATVISLIFKVLLTVHHAMILGNRPIWCTNSFQCIYLFIYSSLHVSSMSCSSSGETNCINTASGNCHSVLVAVSCAATNTEWQLPEAVLIQSVSPDDEHDMLETCREL